MLVMILLKENCELILKELGDHYNCIDSEKNAGKPKNKFID